MHDVQPLGGVRGQRRESIEKSSERYVRGSQAVGRFAPGYFHRILPKSGLKGGGREMGLVLDGRACPGFPLWRHAIGCGGSWPDGGWYGEAVVIGRASLPARDVFSGVRDRSDREWICSCRGAVPEGWALGVGADLSATRATPIPRPLRSRMNSFLQEERSADKPAALSTEAVALRGQTAGGMGTGRHGRSGIAVGSGFRLPGLSKTSMDFSPAPLRASNP
ncbi:hypothetical protein AvCA_29270 [Azotobacter vinelandii CA]|uniref:Uncharacterized protein n=2 Tax=Azotobacter vinelandii TaxID=354 RepID=C1DM09_AZOVD|nr:hypothetical protein Avin_29270 [Azotobacter vinelandii DJ]AGK16499.1 hypothetical protein AvCA_29270 [Azotobacter vinelandii CA]AGK20965.1 hypothetical protein AvCA6_29270 [Azotobacter vinelandii CA6]